MDNLDDLKLRRVHDYSNMQLDKLVFNLSRICFYTSKERHVLENIQLVKGTFEENYQMSEAEYDTIKCPIYHVNANVGPNGQDGIIKGIIKPRINTDIAKLITELPPIFYFYHKEDNSIKIGHSIYVKGHGRETMLISMMPWESRDFAKFVKKFMPYEDYLPSWFEVNIDKKYEEKGMFTTRC